MCRQEIPADFLDHPTLLSSIEAEKEEVLPGGYQWFYEGRNGWWQYDERTSHELEAAYGSGQRACEVLVAGFLYIIDFDRMIQLRRNDPSRRRRIKRDLSSIPKKGVAGIKLPSQLEAELSALHSAADAIHGQDAEHGVPQGGADDHITSTNNDLCPPTPTAPSNTPQTPHTPSAASSSSGSPDTTEHSLAPESHHHHYHYLPHHHHHLHYHQLHIPHHLHLLHNLNSYNDHNLLEHSIHAHHLHHQGPLHHHHHHPPPPAPPPPVPPPAAAHQTQQQTHPPATPGATQETSTEEELDTADAPDSTSTPLDLETAVYQMQQLSLSTDPPEFYPLDSTEDSTEETEQYHLTLSSEEEDDDEQL